MKFVATIRKPVQVGPDDWNMISTSMLFNEQTTFQEILDWSASLGFKATSINDFQLGDFVPPQAIAGTVEVEGE